MTKRIRFIVGALLLLTLTAVFLLVYSLNNVNPYTKYLVNKYVPKYLAAQGYTESDLKEAYYIEPKHMINQSFYHGHYLAVFNDEPNTTYYYGLTKIGRQVKQFCEKDILLADGAMDIFEGNTKHSEEECVYSLNNRD